ncbi:copper transporter [Tumebacillus permanentifrigoris]|uniref:Copper transport outer membrane protein MctB n=1 Tax=Tumebacillus permanentifrigoris TaxID=378543 RepID=A0A316D4J4_9BACL|nr:copper transporter [Tumebacillus permanentifrigoris]PWK05190.1 copper transport outer membrane protein MctB [Tumebacillus permanentifrigoris]
MYGIRYHILTLVAVFLSLGLGLLLGGTLGEQVIVKQQTQLLQKLEERYTQSKSDNLKLQKQSQDLTQQTTDLQNVMAQVGGHYAHDKLTGQKVAVLQLQPADLSSMRSTLEAAGAVLSTAAELQDVPSLTAALSSDEVRELLGVDAAGDEAARSTALSKALVHELFTQGAGPVTSWLQAHNFLNVTGTIGSKPDHLILVGGATDATRPRLRLFDLPLIQEVRALDVHAVGVECSDVALSDVVYFREVGLSTVDNIDQVTGRVALIDVLTGAKGHFGTKKTAQALLPYITNAKEVSTSQ